MITQTLELLRIQLLQMRHGRKILVTFLLLVVLAGVSLLVRMVGDEPASDLEGWGFLSVLLMTFLYLQTVVILIPLLFASSLFRDEIEEGTWVYVISRPIRKSQILLAKYAACTIVSALLVAVGITLFQLGFIIPGGGDFPWFERSLAFVYASVLGVATYGALFTLVGLVTRHALVLGIAYGFISEFVLTNIPAVIKKFTVMHYLRSIALNELAVPDRDLEEVLGLLQLSTPGEAALRLGLTILVALGLSQALISLREFRTARGADVT